jgi:quinol monooxygenase YgiN
LETPQLENIGRVLHDQEPDRLLGKHNRRRQVAIKVIVELKAKPGRRDDLKRLLESLIATQGQGQDGFLGSTRYEVLDDPDTLVEIADWESAQARETHMQEAALTGAYAPLVELLVAPFRAKVISALP